MENPLHSRRTDSHISAYCYQVKLLSKGVAKILYYTEWFLRCFCGSCLLSQMLANLDCWACGKTFAVCMQIHGMYKCNAAINLYMDNDSLLQSQYVCHSYFL